MNFIEELLIILAIVAGIVLIVFILAKYNYLIKKAMIKNGMPVSQTAAKVKYIDIGCILVGLGVGLLISSIFSGMDLSEDTTDLLAWGTICIFGGLGVLLAHRIRRRFEA